MTARGIRARLREMHDVDVSPDRISRVTGGVPGELAGWQSRPLDPVYPVIFTGAVMVKIKDGVVPDRPAWRSASTARAPGRCRACGPGPAPGSRPGSG